MQETKANKPLKKGEFTKQEKNWILYDVANSAYTLLATALLPFFFEFLAPSDSLTTMWGSINVITTIIAVILCPILGTYADFSKKGSIFMIFAQIGFVACALMSIFGVFPDWKYSGLLFVLLFLITEIGYSSANVFYDSMLTDVTSDENMHNVSAQGYAWGYIGSCIPFVICLVIYILGWLVFPEFLGPAFSLCCLITAIWWMFFTLPILSSYKQRHFLPKPKHPIKETFSRLGNIFKDFAKNKKALFFLLAYFFYIDGVHTIIKMAMSIGKDLQFENFGAVKLVLALFVTQIVAFPCAIIFGKIASKFKSEKLLIVCIGAYTAIGLLTVFLRHEWQFWAMAVGVGMFQGGIQAMSRSYFTKIIPAEKSGEYFGIYDIFGKSAAILGVGLITLLSAFFPLKDGTFMNISLIPLPCLFIIGLILFIIAAKMPVSEEVKKQQN